MSPGGRPAWRPALAKRAAAKRRETERRAAPQDPPPRLGKPGLGGGRGPTPAGAPQGDPGHPRATASSCPGRGGAARGVTWLPAAPRCWRPGPGRLSPRPRPRGGGGGGTGLPSSSAPGNGGGPAPPLPAPRSLAAPLHVTEQNPPRHSPLCPARPGHRGGRSPARGGGEGRRRGRREATRRAGAGSASPARPLSAAPPPLPPRPGHLPRRGRLRPSRGAAPGRRRPPCSPMRQDGGRAALPANRR